MPRKFSYMAAACVVAAGFKTAALAKDDTPMHKLIADFKFCRTIPDSAQRLTCLDNAAESLIAAQNNKEVVILDRTEVSRAKRTVFGFNLPKLSLFGGRGDDDEAEQQIETKIDALQSLGHGKWAFRTTEGANWQTTEEMVETPQLGSTLVIKRGAMGSYFIKIRNYRAVRGMRVN